MFNDFEPLEIEVDGWENIFSKSLFDKVLENQESDKLVKLLHVI